MPLSEVTRQQVVKFLWQNVVCQFGLPHTIISDNGINFASKQVVTFCAKYKIAHRSFTSYYPQENGLVKINNRTILDSLCKRLDRVKGKWVEKLRRVLWAIGPPNAS